MTDSWVSGSRIVVPTVGGHAVTVMIDSPVELIAGALEDVKSSGTDLEEVEIRVSFAGPARSGGESLAEILVIAQQVGLGAAGSGVWTGVQAFIDRLRSRHRDQTADNGEPEPRQAVTIVVPTANGPALVHQVTVGAHEPVDIVRIVETLANAQNFGD
jgi:hypothetical protein